MIWALWGWSMSRKWTFQTMSAQNILLFFSWLKYYTDMDTIASLQVILTAVVYRDIYRMSNVHRIITLLIIVRDPCISDGAIYHHSHGRNNYVAAKDFFGFVLQSNLPIWGLHVQVLYQCQYKYHFLELSILHIHLNTLFHFKLFFISSPISKIVSKNYKSNL